MVRGRDCDERQVMSDAGSRDDGGRVNSQFRSAAGDVCDRSRTVMAVHRGLSGSHEFDQQSKRESMPEVYIYVAEGRSVEQKRKVAREMTDVLMSNFNVPPEVVVVQFVELPRDSKARGGVLFSDAAAPPKVGS